MNINSAFPSKYLKATDAEEKDLILTIAKVKIETVGQGAKAEQKPVVYFKEVEKGLCCNKTNARLIASIAKSDDTDDWSGTQIRLISTEVEYQGELMAALRVRNVAKGAKSAPAVDVRRPSGRDYEEQVPVETPDAEDVGF